MLKVCCWSQWWTQCCPRTVQHLCVCMHACLHLPCTPAFCMAGVLHVSIHACLHLECLHYHHQLLNGNARRVVGMSDHRGDTSARPPCWKAKNGRCHQEKCTQARDTCMLARSERKDKSSSTCLDRNTLMVEVAILQDTHGQSDSICPRLSLTLSVSVCRALCETPGS